MAEIKLHKRYKYAGNIIDELLKNDFDLKDAIQLCNNIPDSDVVEVQHGEWVQIGYDKAMDRITCSCCKEYWNINDNDTHTFNYCPNCGTKMDGKERAE